jgi:2-polyprenyl-6-methoxyphenol hydroxylase-like FAD-dependent oxidoreductase
MKTCDAEAIVVGGGPVGLLLAGLLGMAGRQVLLLEAETRPPARSMAIGITPPSLEILSMLDAAPDFIARGVRVRTAFVHEQERIVGRLDLNRLRPPYDFILTLPQAETVRLLHACLRSLPSVRVCTGWRATGLRQDGPRVIVAASDMASGTATTLTAPVAAGCDGARGRVRDWLGIETAGHDYAPAFRMADYPDRSGLAAEAHLFFGPERPVESFPLPGGRRRWIVRCGRRGRGDLDETAEAAIERLVGVPLAAEEARNASAFQPRFALARHFHRGRAALCGDAAHVMSPIGGQGMNTGFGDAADLARTIGAVLDGARPEIAFGEYALGRRRAFKMASRRSAMGMALGVARGAVPSRLRGAFVAALLGRQATHDYLARWFAMLNLPPPLNRLEAT